MAETIQQTNEQLDSQTAWAQTLWRAYLTGDNSQLDPKVMMMRKVFKALPNDPRCKVCNAPFRGIGSVIVRSFGYRTAQSSFNGSLCDRCETIVKKYQVGIELKLTMLFADVRDSTTLAEQIGPSAFHHLINRYFKTGAQVLSKSNALVNRLIGDGVIALYVPGIAGPDHARVAIDAARDLLVATGHTDPAGPWIKVGVGVHTGNVYVGAVGGVDSMSDITVLGDAANTAARLSSQAADGEIVVSEETCRAANLPLQDCETRTLKLKGRNEPVAVRVLRVSPTAAPVA